MKGKFTRIGTLATVATLGLSSAAWAAVTFDPETGSGFVGKGDVQYTYGWNNATLQKNASSVDFRYQAEQDYEITCEFYTEQGGKGGVKTLVHHVSSQELAMGVSRDVNTSVRNNKQGDVNGFILSADGPEVIVGDALPEVGDSCKSGEGNTVGDSITAVEAVGDATGGLLVKWGITSYTALLSPSAL